MHVVCVQLCVIVACYSFIIFTLLYCSLCTYILVINHVVPLKVQPCIALHAVRTCTCIDEHSILMQHPDVREILLIGFYPQSQEMNRFRDDMQRKYGLPIR